MAGCHLAIDIGASSGRHIIGQVTDGRMELTELVQDFGHSTGRNHAASGTTSPSRPNASSARAKNSSMSSAGIR